MKTLSLYVIILEIYVTGCIEMEQKYSDVTVVIDVFRAFTTASYILARSPFCYMLATKSKVIAELASISVNPVLIGKPEKNAFLIYDIPNSPTRSKEIHIKDRTILHRTEAGAKGILQAFENSSSIVLAAGFVNANATARYIKMLKIKNIHILPMGHEATTPSLEDDVCAKYIDALIHDKVISIEAFLLAIRKKSEKYFFSEDQWQYPYEDLDCCLKLKQFNFAIQAMPKEDHAVLTRCDIEF